MIDRANINTRVILLKRFSGRMVSFLKARLLAR
jgi:hypothetical protein